MTHYTAKGAEFSECRLWRYRLWRTWDASLPAVCWIMLNPSKAGADEDDATIRRCVRFAKDWGYGGIAVVNLCALISTDPKALHVLPLEEVVGRQNNHAIGSQVRLPGVGLVVCAWGANVDKHPGLQIRAQQVLAGLNNLGVRPHCLGVTRGGAPLHPLRLPATLRPQPFPVDRPGGPATVA
jgi:hypothetical protein